LKVPIGEFADDFLLRNKFGITDIVKVPRDYGNEPTNLDYKDGLNRILGLINKHKPKVILFVYKRVLDKILDLSFGHKSKSRYGFNAELDKYFKSKVFVFPMPGTPCTRELAIKSMNELQNIIQNLN
jgi:hypothetical protein